jgi:short-subunit dehydrogenase involved in D-alanine esterification of teichoic acids
MNVFISNVTVLAIENCLIKNLEEIFSPILIAGMSDEKLHSIAAESEEIRTERSDLREKLNVLEGGKRVLNEHIGMSFIQHDYLC